MSESNSSAVSSRIKQLLFFRVLCVLLWPVDLISFLLAPVLFFLLAAALHVYFAVRYYRLVYWYLVPLARVEDRQRVK